MANMKKKNISMEISLLEARSGMKPKLNRCKPIAMALKSHTPTAENLEQLSHLREEGIKRKLFAIRKEVQRIAKKARTFALQRIIKKIKSIDATATATSTSTTTITKMENDMKLIKAINLEILSKHLLGEIIEGDDYLKEKISTDLFKKETAENISLIRGNALDKNLKLVQIDLAKYVRVLYHEQIISEEELQEMENKKKEKKERKAAAAAASSAARKRQFCQEDDEDDILTSGGNRKGQRARRLEWEKKYGGSAKHLKDPSMDRSSIRRYKNDIPQNPNPLGRRRDVRLEGGGEGGDGDGGGEFYKSYAPEMTNSKSPTSSTAKNNNAVHPSWEAQRRKREMERISIDSAPANHRITFE